MAKKDRHMPRTAFVTLRDMPGTRVMFWVVDECPYCGDRHLHVIGNLRSADPSDGLGEYPAPCKPERTYELTLPPRSTRKTGRRRGKRVDHEDEDW